MKLVDYTGKLNNHDDYLKIVKTLENKSKYIEYVLVNNEDTAFTDKFTSCVISVAKKNQWWGTKSARKSPVYRLKASKEIFQYLKKYETFCRYAVTDRGDMAEETDFGINDIAFFDDNELPLLFTTTHEGYITVRDDIIR